MDRICTLTLETSDRNKLKPMSHMCLSDHWMLLHTGGSLKEVNDKYSKDPLAHPKRYINHGLITMITEYN